MARFPKHRRTTRPTDAVAPRTAATVSARKVPGEDGWELVHPRCASERADDLAEVRKMIEAGETEVAVDELRWLLNGCSDLIEAHRLLGELALLDHDFALARGHFGYALRIGEGAACAAGTRGPLPYRLPANQALLESAKGLVYSLLELKKFELAKEVASQAIEFDPSDPLGIAALVRAAELKLSQLRTRGYRLVVLLAIHNLDFCTACQTLQVFF